MLKIWNNQIKWNAPPGTLHHRGHSLLVHFCTTGDTFFWYIFAPKGTHSFSAFLHQRWHTSPLGTLNFGPKKDQKGQTIKNLFNCNTDETYYSTHTKNLEANLPPSFFRMLCLLISNMKIEDAFRNSALRIRYC